MKDLLLAVKNLQAAIELLGLDADQSAYKATIGTLLSEATASIAKARASGIGGGEEKNPNP
jgi:hypothetical protein